ncbi:MAG: carboxylesterase family protein [Bryobacteraceae bacterium]|nr:carboxylesterase family protein [Bryobacteraceae bacterium]
MSPLKHNATSIAISLIIMSLSIQHPAHAEIVVTREGKLRSVAGKDPEVAVYRGIPFAAPPLGELRWRPPQPVTPWPDVRVANAFGAYCVGIKFGFIPPAGMNEDCLYLNVWAPAKTPARRLPVMVWIHGGGFQGGGGADPAFDGERLARQGLVVVTCNYRVGVFGFLAHPDLTRESDDHASGNYGLLDQVAVLKWVNRNAEAFGGDPANVTIAGESAGSYSVSALTASPLARGLFHRAIAQSGGYLSPKPGAMRTLEESEKVGVRLAQALGATGASGLRGKSADEVMGAAAKLGDFYAFQPGIDGRFLKEAVYATYAMGQQARVPLLLGSNTEEGAFLLPEQRPSAKEFQTLLATTYGAGASMVQDVYPVDTPANALRSELNLFADSAFTYPMWKWALMHGASGAPVYLYQFGRTLPPMPGQLYKGIARGQLGAFHGDEVAYAFGTLDSAFGALDQWSRKNRWERVDHDLSDAMVGYWSNFVKTGDPNGSGLPDWPRYELGSKHPLMRFHDRPRATPDDRTARMTLLDAAFTESRGAKIVPTSKTRR